MLKYPLTITIDITIPRATAVLAGIVSYWHINKTAPEAVIYSDAMEGRKTVSYRSRQIISLTIICTLAGLGFGYMLDSFIHIPYVNAGLIKCSDKLLHMFGW